MQVKVPIGPAAGRDIGFRPDGGPPPDQVRGSPWVQAAGRPARRAGYGDRRSWLHATGARARGMSKRSPRTTAYSTKTGCARRARTSRPRTVRGRARSHALTRYGWGLLVGQGVTTRDYRLVGCIEYHCRYNQFMRLRATLPQRTRASRDSWRTPGRWLTTDLRAPRTWARCTRWTWGGADDAGRLGRPGHLPHWWLADPARGALLTHRQRQSQEKGAILR